MNTKTKGATEVTPNYLINKQQDANYSLETVLIVETPSMVTFTL